MRQIFNVVGVIASALLVRPAVAAQVCSKDMSNKTVQVAGPVLKSDELTTPGDDEEGSPLKVLRVVVADEASGCRIVVAVPAKCTVGDFARASGGATGLYKGNPTRDYDYGYHSSDVLIRDEKAISLLCTRK